MFKSIFHKLRRKADRFHGDDEASLTIEAVIMLPLLLWAFLATFTYFDVYRAKNLALKANYAVSDLLSREINPINMNYIHGLEDVFAYLTRGGDPAWLRVTVVRCHDKCDLPNDRDLRRDWSKATDGMPTHSNTTIRKVYRKVLPMLSKGERVIMVETMAGYEPPFPPGMTGVRSRQMRDIVMTRPRFAPQLCWEGQGCAN
ncbi:hypothetical protein [Aliiroseovarius subalbicans]|uniref:TadE/TadG family type IV pilus assembly protein n=1 Tax=Aliiroseovarius subalbicans TaxID=2925840 RepID=UPI001F5AE889|nr:hypothetical protein [Aliiroseovarius subalbicans]MCI2398073.1 hypothetical protein [Aliiroseovarius subalbicans]